MGVGAVYIALGSHRFACHRESPFRHKYTNQANCRAFPNAQSEVYPNQSRYANGAGNSNSIVNSNRHVDPNAIKHANRYGDADLYPNTDSDRYKYTNARAHQHADGNVHAAGTRSQTRALCDWNRSDHCKPIQNLVSL